MPPGSPGTYPTPGTTTAYGIGPQWLKMHQFQGAYDQVTDMHIYEDAGVSFVIFNDNPPIIWTIEYDGLGLSGGVSVIDAHRADAFGHVYPFDFTNPRTSVTYQNVRYMPEFEEDHRKTWINKRIIRLIQRPS